MTRITSGALTRAALLGATMLAGASSAFAVNTVIDGNDGTLPLPTGQYVTPVPLPGWNQQFLNPHLSTANNPNYANFVAGEAVRSQLSPDGKTLAIVTAGQNSLNDKTGATDVANSTQYVFLYDVSGANQASPVLSQVIQQPNAHVGLVWGGNDTLYVAGGADDSVYVYTRSGGTFSKAASISLGHGETAPFAGAGKGVGLFVEPNASGLALSADGKTLVAVNNYNDSISVIDTATRTVRYEHDLRPYFARNEGTSGVAGGEYPIAVAVKGNGTAYVGSFRDRDVAVVDVSGATSGKLVTRIKLDGNAGGMTFGPGQATLYVAQDNADQVAAIDTATNTVAARIDTRAPAGALGGAKYTGASPFAVTVSPDGRTLYAVNSGSNSVAVIPLSGAGANAVSGLIPTAYAPKDVTFSQDGARMWIINGKSDTGPNPSNLYGFGSNTSLLTQTTYPGGNAAADAAGQASNQYQFQLEHSTLVSAPVPTAPELATLTAAVERNNFYSVAPPASDAATMGFLKGRVSHVIYIVKENRTFDQVLGDLSNGANTDPSLTIFGRKITPNFHRLASSFVTLDNFMDAADGSMDGWSLSTQGRVTVNEELNQQLNYANVDRGVSYDTEGSNRNVPVGLAATAARDAATGGLFSAVSAGLPDGAANLLPGLNNHTAADAPFGIQKGYIYDAVLQAGGTVRNYGFLVNNIGSIGTKAAPVIDPFGAGVVQVAALDPSLLDKTDVYFRGFDQAYPDLWRYNEWKREFDQYVKGGDLPTLETVRFSHDHTGSFGAALAGVNTPEAQQADNDVSVARLIDAVAHSPYADSTVILITEDDSQDGPDHVDSHRATAYAVGAYVRKNAVVDTRYSQVNVLRTIEDIIGTQHINLNTAYQRPMAEVFDVTKPAAWTYTAVASTILKTTTLQLASLDDGVRYAEGPDAVPAHDAAYWEKATRGFDFSKEDRVPPGLFNEVLWAGLAGERPYPGVRSAAAAGDASRKED